MQPISNMKLDQIEPALSPAVKRERLFKALAHFVVLVLSLLLIVFISYDTFEGKDFLDSRSYMTFQFWVCVIFLADFFIEWHLSADHKAYLPRHWFFFLISIPYLNIINLLDIQFSSEELYYIRFIPLIRGAYSLAMVVGYFFSNRAYSLLLQYAAILVSILYLSSLIFFYEEGSVNSDVNTYWDALYWACMNCTTVGSYINAVTVGGKVLAVVLAVSGMMMLPLFTVFITARVRDYNDKRRQQEAQLRAIIDARHTQNDKTPSSTKS